ncbi:sodium:calcium antiporter [Candidatus Uabimicrobium sp. HlEnr_7]|uniref:sodium:calcium antiporter n=1 Tax=Candidatus Uabimicrobium helgolandensis TaxID=3095367 RepID=UPI0035570302
MEHLQIWGSFLVSAILIIFAGVKLTKYGDILSERLNLGHAFIGAVLIGWSTSLPELVLSIGTAVYANAPNITMGNVLGSNLFNIFIIVILDIVYHQGAILRSVEKKVSLSTILSLMMVCAVGTCLYLNVSGKIDISSIDLGFSKLGYDSVVIFSMYLICMVVLFRSDRGGAKADTVKKYDGITLGSVLLKCLFVIGIIVGTGLWLSDIATDINRVYELDAGFVGSFFLAIVSSLPEVMTCFIAVRMGFNNMAIGTLFGSNVFNMGIIAFCDVFYPGHLFKQFNSSHYTGVIFVILLTFVTLGTLKFKQGKQAKFIGSESLLIAGLYLLGMYTIYDPSWLRMIFGS